MAKVRAVEHGRVKPRYNAVPTAAEKRYHLWLMETFPCNCGCGKLSTVVHHPLNRHPAQRWRRDHEYVVPMNGDCHMELHRRGSEEYTFALTAHAHRAHAIELGLLEEV